MHIFGFSLPGRRGRRPLRSRFYAVRVDPVLVAIYEKAASVPHAGTEAVFLLMLFPGIPPPSSLPGEEGQRFNQLADERRLDFLIINCNLRIIFATICNCCGFRRFDLCNVYASNIFHAVFALPLINSLLFYNCRRLSSIGISYCRSCNFSVSSADVGSIRGLTCLLQQERR